jgi:hypothetical protein
MTLAHAQAHPEDLVAFRRAWSHFQTRERAGALDPVKPGTPRATLQEQAARRAARALEAEARDFAKGTDGMGAGGARCIAHLDDARTWREAGNLDVAPVRDRAVARGDARARGTSLVELAEAKRFYRFAERADKVEQVRKNAAAEGERAAAAGDRLRAAQLFAIADQQDRAAELAPKVDAVKLPDADEVRQQLQKTDAEKEKFRKEQADLEKELGL